jgi:cholesterol oxidase
VERPNAHGAMQGTCVHLGNCDIGCDVNARNTLDLNYLFVAENRHQADIRPLHLVTNITPDAGGYRVSFDRISGGTRVPGSETAPVVIVAAGSLGSTELLLRCRDVTGTLPNLSPRLGKSWSSNGDFLTPAFHWNRDVEPTKGPTIASAIDFQDGSQGGRAFWVEDGGLPNVFANFIAEKSTDPTVGFKLQVALRAMQMFLRENEPFKNIMPWFAQGVDAADGQLRLVSAPGGGTRLHLDWDVTESRKVVDAIVDMHVQLAAATGGLALVPLTWSLFQDLVTPHPLGGCNMGATASTGVVDHRGEVFGHPKLYVVDGAIVPRAIGVNPSRTIAALAERIAAIIVDEHGH